MRKPRRQRVQKSRVAEMGKTRRLIHLCPKTRASLLRGHQLRLQNLLQTVNWRQWIKSGQSAAVGWKLCYCQDLSTSQWLSLQPSLHQPVLWTILSHFLSLHRPTTVHQQQQRTNQLAILHQRPRSNKQALYYRPAMYQPGY